MILSVSREFGIPLTAEDFGGELRCGMVWYGMVWYGMVWYGMVWYGMVWYGMVQCGVVWYGINGLLYKNNI